MRETPDIRIFIACHKPTYVPENPLLYPVQVGSALAKSHFEGMQRDDEGDNISVKNPEYCELTAQYWAWKNVSCDYYGFFHYRRYLAFDGVCPVDEQGHLKTGKGRRPYTELDSIWDDLAPYRLHSDWMNSQIRQYDLLTVFRERINTTVYRQFCQYHPAETLDRILNILKRRYPEYADSADAYMNSKEIYYMNMYIMKKDLFQTYMAWLFGILEEFEQENKSADRPSQPRLMGYLAERLFGIFYFYQRANGAKCAELPYLKFYNTEPGKEASTSNVRTFRLKPTKLEIKIDMRKLNRMFPAGSLRRVILRSIFLR